MSISFSRATAGICFLAVFVFKASAAELKVGWLTNSLGQVSAVATGFDRQAKQKLSIQGRSSSDWQKILGVYAQIGANPLEVIDLPPMIGSYLVEDGKLVFTPQFPLQPGIEYVAMLRPRELGLPETLTLSASIKLPRIEAVPTAQVENIFPTASELPENLLKFYVQFSHPMSGGGIYDHIQLLNEKNEPVELPFLEIDEELWNPEMTRLTLFIDLGRIKRGVKPLEDIGPALEAGHSFVLRISEKWQDANGARLKEPFEKRFKVTAPDRSSPDHTKWTIKIPPPKSRDFLEIQFGEPLDYALTLRLLRVMDSNGNLVLGNSELTNDERVWRFQPDSNWTKGDYQLQFENILEDLAGNSLGKPFEVDLFEGVQKKLTRTTLSREFKIN